MKEGALTVTTDLLLDRGQLIEVHGGKVPPVRFCNSQDLVLRLREADVQHLLTLVGPLHEELQGKCGFSHAGVTFYQIQAVGWQPAAEDHVEALHAHFATSGRCCRRTCGIIVRWMGHGSRWL